MKGKLYARKPYELVPDRAPYGRASLAPKRFGLQKSKEIKENSPRPVWDSHSIQVVVWSDTPRGQVHR